MPSLAQYTAPSDDSKDAPGAALPAVPTFDQNEINPYAAAEHDAATDAQLESSKASAVSAAHRAGPRRMRIHLVVLSESAQIGELQDPTSSATVLGDLALATSSYQSSSLFQAVQQQYVKTGVGSKVKVQGGAELVEVLLFNSGVDIAPPLAEAHNAQALLRYLIAQGYTARSSINDVFVLALPSMQQGTQPRNALGVQSCQGICGYSKFAAMSVKSKQIIAPYIVVPNVLECANPAACAAPEAAQSDWSHPVGGAMAAVLATELTKTYTNPLLGGFVGLESEQAYAEC